LHQFALNFLNQLNRQNEFLHEFVHVNLDLLPKFKSKYEIIFVGCEHTDIDGTTRSNCRFIVNIACDRLDTLFIRVDAVVRLRAPSFKQSIV
jgi:hypothetical protein